MFLVIFLSFAFFNISSCSAAPSEFVGLIPCIHDEDCKNFMNATCVQPTCMCNGTTTCTALVETVVTKIGENCTKTEECNIEFSVCEKNQCSCKSGYVKSVSGKKCLIVSDGFEGTCEESIQCSSKLENSVCENNKCVCEEMHEFDGICFRNVELGQACQSDQECSINMFASCQNSTCTCIDGYVHSVPNEICVPAAKGEDSPCLENLQCTTTLGEFSHCIDTVCKCRESFHYKEKINKCVEDRFFGDTCVIHSDCREPFPDRESRLECIAGECKCRSFYKEKNGICIDSHGYHISASFCLLILVHISRMFIQ